MKQHDDIYGPGDDDYGRNPRIGEGTAYPEYRIDWEKATRGCPEGFADWNKLSMDDYANYLERKYMFSSTGEAKCIMELIKYYRNSLKTNLNQTDMKVKAKFTCNALVPNSWGHGVHAHFHAVYGTEGENADFAKATPCGNVDMQIEDNTPAIDFFKQGKDYYIYFEEVGK